MTELLCQTIDSINTFRKNHPTQTQASSSELSKIFQSVEGIMMGDSCSDKVIDLVISMNILCQSDVGNLDCIVRLWKIYLPFLKKRSSAINKVGANQFYSALNNFVIEGISSSLTKNTEGDVQLTIKLQLLLFFMQRLFATFVLLSHHLGSEEQSQCVFYVSTLRGFLSALSKEYESVQISFIPKVDELYRKLIRDNFVLAHHSSLLTAVCKWTSQTDPPRHISSKLHYALVGVVCLVDIDLARATERPAGDISVLARLCVETFLVAASGLVCLFCGRVPDSLLLDANRRIAVSLCTFVACADAEASSEGGGACSLLEFLLSSSLGFQSGSKGNTILRKERVRAHWSRLLLVQVLAGSSQDLRAEVSQAIISLLPRSLQAPSAPSYTPELMGTLCRAIVIASVARGDEESVRGLAEALSTEVDNCRKGKYASVCAEVFVKAVMPPMPDTLCKIPPKWSADLQEKALRVLAGALASTYIPCTGVPIAALGSLGTTSSMKTTRGPPPSQLALPAFTNIMQRIAVIVRFSLKLAKSDAHCKKRFSNGMQANRPSIPFSRIKSAFASLGTASDCASYLSACSHGDSALSDLCLGICSEVCQLLDFCSAPDATTPRPGTEKVACCAEIVTVCCKLITLYCHIDASSKPGTHIIMKCKSIFHILFDCCCRFCPDGVSLITVEGMSHFVCAMSNSIIKSARKIAHVAQNLQMRTQLSQILPHNILPHVNARSERETLKLTRSAERIEASYDSIFRAAMVESQWGDR